MRSARGFAAAAIIASLQMSWPAQAQQNPAFGPGQPFPEPQTGIGEGGPDAQIPELGPEAAPAAPVFSPDSDLMRPPSPAFRISVPADNIAIYNPYDTALAASLHYGDMSVDLDLDPQVIKVIDCSPCSEPVSVRISTGGEELAFAVALGSSYRIAVRNNRWVLVEAP